MYIQYTHMHLIYVMYLYIYFINVDIQLCILCVLIIFNVYTSTWRAAVAQKHDPGGSCFVSLGTIPQRAWKILGHSKKYSRRR
jgi:hypothetical protein